MPKVIHVKRARKPIPSIGVAVGDPYYHWTFRNPRGKGTRMVSKTKPTRSQLTRSDFYSTLYDLEDSYAAEGGVDEVKEGLESLASELEDLSSECESRKDNMPEGLQESETGQLLAERAERCSSLADEVRDLCGEVDSAADGCDDPDEEGLTDEEREQREEDRDQAARDAANDGVAGLDWGID